MYVKVLQTVMSLMLLECADAIYDICFETLQHVKAVTIHCSTSS